MTMINVKDLSSRHRQTLDDIMTEPPKVGVKWEDITAFIKATGGTIKKNDGSRRKFQIGKTKFHTHEPHPQSTIDRGALAGLREWLVNSVRVNYE